MSAAATKVGLVVHVLVFHFMYDDYIYDLRLLLLTSVVLYTRYYSETHIQRVAYFKTYSSQSRH